MKLSKMSKWRAVLLRLFPLLAAFLLADLVPLRADLQDDAAALSAFRNAVDPRNHLQWSLPANVCEWQGVQCGGDPLRVTTIRLPGSALYGHLPSGTIGRLTQLRVLSLRQNKLSGTFPSDLAHCAFLSKLYLQNNAFSGPLPSNFSLWPLLSHVDLSNNRFTGTIPSSFNSLLHLRSLYLQNNSFSGPLPALNIASLGNFSIANNYLNGSIPVTMQTFPKDAFAGNNLCGIPLDDCSVNGAPRTSEAGPLLDSHRKKRLGTGAIVGIALGAAAFLLLLIAACVFLCRKDKDREPAVLAKDRAFEETPVEVVTDIPPKPAPALSAAQPPDRSKLVFFDNKLTFDLEDLLRASAEVLGKGSVGTAYKAILEDGSVLAVKRLKDVVIERKDFEQQIDMMGKLRHKNLVPLRAYFFSKEEKLLVYDYKPMGSLSALLHGNKGSGRTPLNWDTRLRIAAGAAQGICYIHESGNQRSIHGNIKSSNVLLTKELDACVSDYGLAQLVSSTPAANRIVGYRAPEVTDIKKITQKADVYSFGVLLLELLTGKAPAQASLHEDGIDLPRWVQSVVKEEWTSEVFDLELMRYQDIEEEMVQLLQVAMDCVLPSPDQRPTMKQLVKMIEDLKKNADGVSKQSEHVDENSVDAVHVQDSLDR